MKKQLIQSVKIITLALLIGLGAQYIMAAAGSGGSSQAGIWTGPAGAPPTQNKGAPINVTTQEQAKATSPLSGVTLNIGGLFAADNISSFGYVASGDLSQANNGSATYPAHVCADTNGKLIVCPGPAAPGSHQQVYTISGGTQVSSGDCVLCNGTTFITPTGVTEFTVSLIGGGGGGGGAMHYISKIVTIPQCNNAAGCDIAVTGSGGGGGGFSTFSVPSQAGLSYSVEVGSGGRGGSSIDAGYQSSSTVNGSAQSGANGGYSLFSGMFGGVSVSAKANGGGGGGGGNGGNGYHAPGNPSVGNGGSIGYGTVTPGVSGKIGYVSIYGDTGSFYSTAQPGITTGFGGASGYSSSIGNGGNGSTNTGGSGSGTDGANGQVIVTWTQ